MNKKSEPQLPGWAIAIGIIVLVIIFVNMCSDDEIMPAPEDYTTHTETPAIGSVEWQNEALTKLIQDSTEVAIGGGYFTNIAKSTNGSISDAIDKLNSTCTDYVSAQSFYTTNARAKSILSFLQKRKTAIKKQIMPTYRKAFAKNLATAMWEHDIYVTASGTGNTILNVTGGTFASNSNIKTYYEILNMDAKHFEFKQIRFRWYEGATDYTYYSLE